MTDVQCSVTVRRCSQPCRGRRRQGPSRVRSCVSQCQCTCAKCVRARMHTSLGVSRYYNHLDKMRRTDTEQAHCMSLRHTRDAYSLELSYNKRRDWSVLRWGIPRLANVRPSHKAFLLVVFPHQLMAMPVCWNYSVTSTQTVF